MRVADRRRAPEVGGPRLREDAATSCATSTAACRTARWRSPTRPTGSATSLCFHGHYLDAHMTGSLSNRHAHAGDLGRRRRRTADASSAIEDYEAAIVPADRAPLHRRPAPARHRGAAGRPRPSSSASRTSRRSCGRPSASCAASPGRSAPQPGERRRPDPQAVDPSAHPSDALCAYGKVVRNLGWDRETKTMVFAHTHQPLDDRADDTDDGLRFWNTGSWIYEPPSSDPEAWQRYRERAWPGSVGPPRHQPARARAGPAARGLRGRGPGLAARKHRLSPGQ